MVIPSARFRDYLLAYWESWFALMSGGLSVPAAVSALYVQNDTARAALWITAALALVLSGYFVWRLERQKVIGLSKSERLEEWRAALGELRAIGVKLRNDAQFGFHEGDIDLKKWIGEATDWNINVIQTIRALYPAEATWFQTLDVIPEARISLRLEKGLIGTEDGDRAVFLWPMHDFRLVKLEEIIKKYRQSDVRW
jgi:hypothetical protein